MPRLLGGESECLTLVCAPVRPLKIKRASAASGHFHQRGLGDRAPATLAAEGTAAFHTVNRRL